MPARGRKSGFQMSNDHRVKIQNSNILNALIEHVEGKREMSATQVSAGLGLLKKVLPDLAASADAGGNGELVSFDKMTDSELESILRRNSDRASKTQESTRIVN